MTTLPQGIPPIFGKRTALADAPGAAAARERAAVEDLMVQQFMGLSKLEAALEAFKRRMTGQIHLCDRNIFALQQWRNQMQILQERRKPNPGAKRMSLFVDEEGLAAPSNPDAIDKATNRQQLPHHRRKYDWNVRTWTDNEKDKLEETVADRLTQDLSFLLVEEKIVEGEVKESQADNKMQQTLSILSSIGLQECLTHLEHALTRKEARCNAERLASEEDSDARGPVSKSEPVDEEEEDSTALKGEDSLPVEFSITEYWVSFWDNVAREVAGRVDRSGKDCQIQWMHHHDPTVNRNPWTKEEDLRILALAAKYNGRHWQSIAHNAASGRTAYQCFERYQRALNKGLMKGEWTKKEDEELMRAVEEFSVKSKGACKWNRVATRLPGRTNYQCRARYMHSLKENLKHGGWAPEEDVRVQLLVAAYGRGNWSKIAPHMPGRTDMKCRERYENVLRTDLRKGPWTEQEIQCLLLGIKQYGPGNWALVKTMIPGRTDSDCSRQWQRVDPFACVLYDCLRAAKLRMLPKCNRGSRRKDKTSLTGADFQVDVLNHLVIAMQHTLKNRPTTPQTFEAPVATPALSTTSSASSAPSASPADSSSARPTSATATSIDSATPSSAPSSTPAPSSSDSHTPPSTATPLTSQGNRELEELQKSIQQLQQKSACKKQLYQLKIYLDALSTGDLEADKHLTRIKKQLIRLKEKEFGLKKDSFLDVQLTEEEQLAALPITSVALTTACLAHNQPTFPQDAPSPSSIPPSIHQQANEASASSTALPSAAVPEANAKPVNSSVSPA